MRLTNIMCKTASPVRGGGRRPFTSWLEAPFDEVPNVAEVGWWLKKHGVGGMDIERAIDDAKKQHEVLAEEGKADPDIEIDVPKFLVRWEPGMTERLIKAWGRQPEYYKHHAEAATTVELPSDRWTSQAILAWAKKQGIDVNVSASKANMLKTIHEAVEARSAPPAHASPPVAADPD